jgi:hypothetical protein
MTVMTAPISTFRNFRPPTFEEVRPLVIVPRAQLPQEALAAEATTLGWDTVNAIRIAQVNRTLNAFPPPPDFSYSIQPGWTISGAFGKWSLVRGGSGSIIFLRTPLNSSRMTFPGQADLAFVDGWATIQIKLQYLPQVPVKDGARLTVPENGEPNFLLRDAEDRSEDDPAVVLQAVSFGKTKPNTLMDALYRQAIVEYFKANLDVFVYVFTLVNINARASEGAFQWLKPTYTSYAYFNGPDDETSFFGVLNMTDGRSSTGLTNQMPPGAVPQDGNAAVLISNERFLQKMVLPGLPKAFTKASASDFTLANNNTTIKTSKDVTMDDIEINGISYTPTLKDFLFQIIGDEIQIATVVQIDPMPGLHVIVATKSWYRVTVVTKTDGSKTLDFVEARKALVDSYYKKEDWLTITEIIISVITAIATLGAGKILETAVRKIVAIVIIIIVGGLIAAIPTIIAAVVSGKAAEALPSLGKLVTEATGDIHWPEASGFDLVSAQLNGSLVLGGDLLDIGSG